MADRSKSSRWNFPVVNSLLAPGDNGELPSPPGNGEPSPPGDGEQPAPPSRDPDEAKDELANQLDHDELANLRRDNHHAKTTAEEVSADVRADRGSPLFVETRTSDPVDPAPGRIWIRTDE